MTSIALFSAATDGLAHEAQSAPPETGDRSARNKALIQRSFAARATSIVVPVSY